MYPLKFKPILKTVVWGGEKIAPFKHIETDQHHIGESWELSGVAGNESVVANGAWKGRSIADLVREYKGCLVGQHVYDNTGDQFPLLIKFIDALSDLSIQVHPNDALAYVRHNGSKGKTETAARARPKCGMSSPPSRAPTCWPALDKANSVTNQTGRSNATGQTTSIAIFICVGYPA